MRVQTVGEGFDLRKRAIDRSGIHGVQVAQSEEQSPH